jgi:hypothetical protein
MQLQHLCLKLDDDIRDQLGRNPPALDELYSKVYNKLFEDRREIKRLYITRNLFSWLLCSREMLHTTEMLALVSITPQMARLNRCIPVSKEQVLDMCCDFIAYDAELDTLRFAHLSVREFLEKLPTYDRTWTNCLAADICLQALTPDPAAGIHDSEQFGTYPAIYWATHCQFARDKRRGFLKPRLDRFLSGESDPTSPIAVWNSELRMLIAKDAIPWELDLKYRDIIRAPTRSLFIACVFDFAEVVQSHMTERSFQEDIENGNRRTLLHAAVVHGSQEVAYLLLKARLRVTENALEAAAKSRSKSAQEMVRLLLTHGANVKITPKVVQAAAENWLKGGEITALLLRHGGRFNEKAFEAATRNYFKGKEVTMLLLNEYTGQFPITDRLVRKIARQFNRELVTLLVGQCGRAIKTIEGIARAAARNAEHGLEVMEFLFEACGSQLEITKDVIMAAAKTFPSGPQVMRLLLCKYEDQFEISEEMFEAAATSWDGDGIKMLLEKRGKQCKITPKLMIAAAENGDFAPLAMEALLDYCDNQFEITEEVLSAAADTGVEAIELLLQRCGSRFRITEPVLKAAVGGWKAKEVTAMLLEQRSDEINITEEVLKTAASVEGGETHALGMLLKQPCDPSNITEDVFEAAAGNEGHGMEMVKLLLDNCARHVKITERIFKAAAGNWKGEKIIALLFEYGGDESEVTPEVLQAAAENEYGLEVMELLLEKRGHQIKITEQIFKAAAGARKGEQMVALLFKYSGDESAVTPEVLQAAAENEYGLEVMKLLLGKRNTVTEEVAKAAAANTKIGKELTMLLLHNEAIFTEAGVATAAANGNKKCYT